MSIPSMQYKRWTHDRLAQTHLVRQNASATRLGRLGEFQAEFSRVRVVVERLVVHDRARGLREGISVNQARSAVALWRNAGNELLPQRMHRQSLSRVLFSTFHRAHPLESLLLVCRSRWIRSSPFARLGSSSHPRRLSAKVSAGSISGRLASFLIAFESAERMISSCQEGGEKG